MAIRGSKFHIEQEMFTRLVGGKKIVTLPVGWFAISSILIPDKQERRLAHGKWHKISHRSIKYDETNTVYRILRFAPQLSAGKGDEQAEIAMDYIAWLDLNGRADSVENSLDLSIERVNWVSALKIAFSHPDPSFRLSSLLAFVSVGLGVLALFITFMSF